MQCWVTTYGESAASDLWTGTIGDALSLSEEAQSVSKPGPPSGGYDVRPTLRPPQSNGNDSAMSFISQPRSTSWSLDAKSTSLEISTASHFCKR
ncbi:hypothetical protein PCANC_00824 [Puccinia coronata f. sp. avenae]|uniref:Uncharacterized protein n=1 Tax=Puccinia coronata f. sp. avenae TaxID=200324 RepID=A0A2N5W7L1_9BASI|nr:hypothetical protein PCANC_00824 [Puccinia coronata f. sp. avenae]